MTYRLNIVMVIPGMAFDGDTPKVASLGGSETAAVYMARELVKRGHDVTVFSNLPNQEGMFDGVSYAPIQQATEVIQKAPHDVLIVQREPRFFGFTTASKINILWNHDLAMKLFAQSHQGALWNIDWVFLLSRFHVEQVTSVYSFLPETFTRQTRNGIDLDDFPLPRSGQKIPKKVMYGARPERGLINLVKPGGIMEKLKLVDPDVHLYVVGYDNTTPQMENLYNYLWARCDHLPNVTNLGHLTKKELYNHYSEAELYLYPTEFEEISCITAMECMVSGTPFVTTPLAALPETLGDKTSVMVEGQASRMDYQDRFVGEVLGLLSDKARLKKLRHQCRERAREFTWSGVAKQWEDYILEHFDNKTSDKKKLIRHFLYNDDVVVAKAIANDIQDNEALKDIHAKCSWAFDERRHRQHYNEFAETEYIDRPIEHVANHFDRVFPREERWRATQERFRELKVDKDSKILDVGCGCGYFSVAIANKYDCFVVGIDAAVEYVEQARNLANQRLEKGNTLFFHDLDSAWTEHGPFDVIYIAEILEHLAFIDPVEFVQNLEMHLKSEGRFVITTPFGPLKYATGKRGHHHDLHVRHLEHADIQDMFGAKEDFDHEILYWQHTLFTKELLGWYLYSFGKDGSYGEINADRKTTVQIPRETLSVCMIAKNEEAVIKKTLNSIYEIADQIVVIDTGSTDNTAKICDEYGADVSQGSDPLVHGFETPRNESIELATADWILWIDADEELQGADNLPKYCRNNAYDGFRIRQHHFSCQPPGVHKIDKPVRMFRRRPDVRFYGLIHEHPGRNPNDGTGNVIEITDVDIAHGGYYTEPQRRKKFWRNLPLMLKDIEKYPERVLGKWLYMRDLIHLVHWSIEKTGGLNDEATKRLYEVIQIYRNNFLSLGGHMMADGLEYYSTALKLLGQGHEFAWSVNVGNGNVQPEQIRTSRFADVEDFDLFLKSSMKDRLWSFEGKYAG